MKKKILLVTIMLSLLLIGSIFVTAQKINNNVIRINSEKDEIWFKNNPDSLPIWLTQEELNKFDKIDAGFEGYPPPPEPIRMPAEFEQMQGVLIRYSFGISYQIIAEMSEDVEVVTIVGSEGDKNYVISQYQSHGVNLDNCDFLIAPSDSYWTRDYGPWFIFNGDGEQGIVDMIYNRPRPNDDLIPTRFGNAFDIPVYNMNLEHSGGNYMTDGQGIAVSTDLVWSENPGFSHAQINQIMQDYCGIETYHVVPDVLGAYIKHIDCWAKYLAPDIIMIIEVQESDPRYNIIEDAVEYFENKSSCYGTPYKIERIYTHTTSTQTPPVGEPYINSLILNNKILVPLTGSQWDDEAIASYEAALPGYEVIGFSGSWAPTDALHCRAKGIVDRYMLYINHTPLYGIHEGHDGYEIISKIIPYSKENLKTTSTGIYWKIEGGAWNFIEMESLGDNEYRAVIPPQETGTVVYYYIHAEDFSGRSENHPYIGEPMAYSFECNLTNEPPLKPSIKGPIGGDVNQELEFIFESTDPEEDMIYYFIKWGDGNNEEWIGPYESGKEIILEHTWTYTANFTIEAKVKDTFDYESDWESINVNIPRTKLYHGRLIDMFSFPFRLLKYLKFLF